MKPGVTPIYTQLIAMVVFSDFDAEGCLWGAVFIEAKRYFM